MNIDGFTGSHILIEKAVFVHQNIEFGHIVKFGIHHIIVCSYLNLLMIAAEHG